MSSQSLQNKTAQRIIFWQLTSYCASGSLGALKFLLLHSEPKQVGQDDSSIQAGLHSTDKMTWDFLTYDNIFPSGRLLNKGKLMLCS